MSEVHEIEGETEASLMGETMIVVTFDVSRGPIIYHKSISPLIYSSTTGALINMRTSRIVKANISETGVCSEAQTP